MLPRAIARNVAYVPGEGFYAGGAGKNHMRLNFSFVEPERIRSGIELLSEVIRERMELRSDLERGSQRPSRRSASRSTIGRAGKGGFWILEGPVVWRGGNSWEQIGRASCREMEKISG